MVTLSTDLQAEIGEFLMGEEHSDYVFECLNTGKHDFVLRYLRGSAPSPTWAAVFEHLARCVDDNELTVAAATLRKYAQRQTFRESLVRRCEEEMREQESR